MIGFYDYTLILTLSSLVSAVIGITFAIGGKFRAAILCLIISGICDGLDGRVARTKKNRTDDEKSFGVQLDSMCDMIAFCALPMVTTYMAGGSGILNLVSVCFYGICSVIRLSYYNMKEINRMAMDVPSEKVYYGLPVTSSAIIFPGMLITEALWCGRLIPVSFTAASFITGFLFIRNFEIRRPVKIVIYGAAALLIIVITALIAKSGGNPFVYIAQSISLIP